jgi:S1-C subfamily serine protease
MKQPIPLCIALGLCASLPSSGQPIKELVRGARESVLSLRLYGPSGQEIGSGTGFVVAEGLVATNYHVAASAARIEAVLASDETIEASAVVAEDEENDLALLAFGGLDALPLPLAEGAQVEQGDPIVVLGNPLGLAGSISDGIVAAVRPDGLGSESPLFRNTPLLQVTAPISPGSSGSPVIGADGRVVGVAVGGYVLGQNLNFAIPAPTLVGLIRSSDLGGELRPLGRRRQASTRSLVRNLTISALFLGAIAVALWRMRD